MAGPPDPATTEWVPIWNPMGAGPAGPTGPTGATGPQGTPGEQWYSGNGVPSGSLAGSIVGDFYLDRLTGDVYEKTATTTWTLIANIKGPQGIQGIQGPQGVQGPTGPSGATAAHHATHEPGGSDFLVNSTWTNLPNTFTANQTLSYGTPQLIYHDTSGAANAKRWSTLVSGGDLYIQARTDADAFQSNALRIGRTGQLYERDRTTPIGEWISVAYLGTNFFGSASLVWSVASGDVKANRYTLIGKTLTWNLRIDLSDLSGTTTNVLNIKIPGGFLCGAIFQTICGLTSNGIFSFGYIGGGVGGNSLQITRTDFGNFTLGTDVIYLWMSISFEIQ